MRHNKTRETIIRDGILDKKNFKQGPLFILMEPNGKDLEGKSSLRAALLDERKRGKQTHKNLAMWTRMLIEEPELNFEIRPEDVVAFLRQAAVINLKKCPGDGHVKYGDIRRAVECKTNRQRIAKQINGIRPSKIVLCFCQELQDMFEDRFGGLLPSGTPIIRLRHPARAGYKRTQKKLRERLRENRRYIRDKENLEGAR